MTPCSRCQHLEQAIRELVGIVKGDRDFCLGNGYPEDYATVDRAEALLASLLPTQEAATPVSIAHFASGLQLDDEDDA